MIIKLPIYVHKSISNEYVINYFNDKNSSGYLYSELVHNKDMVIDNCTPTIDRFSTISPMNLCGKYKKIYIENNQLYGDLELFSKNYNSEFVLDFYKTLPDRVYGGIRYIKSDNSKYALIKDILIIDTIISNECDKDYIIDNYLVDYNEQKKYENESKKNISIDLFNIIDNKEDKK